jgi:hypothetical protein
MSMRVLAIEHDGPRASDAGSVDRLRREARRVWELQQADVIREVYFRADRAAAVLLLECPDLEAARTAVDTLPLAADGAVEFELIPLAPYPGFARLFVTARPEGA